MQSTIKQYDIRQAVFADWNYKIDNKDTLDKLVLNILNDGILSLPVIRINEDGQEEVIDGNHRKQAIEFILDTVERAKDKLARKGKPNEKDGKIYKLYKEKNYDFSTVPVIYVGQISLAQAKKISVKLNETRFDSDPKILGQTLQDIINEYTPEVFEEIPFSMEEYEMLIESATEESRKRTFDIGDGVDKTFDKFETDIRTIKVECTLATYELFLSIRQKLASIGVTNDIKVMETILLEFDKIPLQKIRV